MFQHNLAEGYQLYKMFESNPKIRDSVFSLGRKIINFIEWERFDPRTVKLQLMSPAGELNKIHITLLAAEYTTEPLVDLVQENPQDPSYKLSAVVESLYKSILGENGWLLGYVNLCPAFCEATYTVTRFIHNQFYKEYRRDFWEIMRWDVGDVDGDLVIIGSFR